MEVIQMNNVYIERGEVKFNDDSNSDRHLNMVEFLTNLKRSADYSDRFRNFVHFERAKLKPKEADERLLQYFCDGEVDGYYELFLLDLNSEEAVWQFIEDNNLNSEEIEYIYTDYDCTGQKFGGKPYIKRLCDNRYVLRYHYSFDV
jgi:hypothetical protein